MLKCTSYHEAIGRFVIKRRPHGLDFWLEAFKEVWGASLLGRHIHIHTYVGAHIQTYTRNSVSAYIHMCTHRRIYKIVRRNICKVAWKPIALFKNLKFLLLYTFFPFFNMKTTDSVDGNNSLIIVVWTVSVIWILRCL